MTRSRLGVALLLPEPIRTEVRALRRAVGSPSLDTQPPHITLVPQVNVRESNLDDALAIVRAAAAAAGGPLRLRLGPAASFGPVSPVLYLGVHGDDVGRLVRLPPQLLRGPLARRVDHDYVPHCTLHESASDELLAAGLRSLAEYRSVFDIDRIDVLRQDDDRVWRSMADVPLGPPVVRGRGGVELVLRATGRPAPDVAALFAELASQADPSVRGWCVEARSPGGALRGAAAGRMHGVAALMWVDSVAVDLVERRQGIGDRLLGETLLLGAQAGLAEVWASVPAQAWEREWLGRRGFVVERERAVPARGHGGGSLVEMVRPLGSA